MRKTLLFLSTLLCLLVACGDETPELKVADKASVPRPLPLKYEIVKTTPHDTSFSTRGLLLHEGSYYESTGKLWPRIYTLRILE